MVGTHPPRVPHARAPAYPGPSQIRGFAGAPRTGSGGPLGYAGEARVGGLGGLAPEGDQNTTTLRSTSPRSILLKAASTSPRAMVSETNLSSGRRPSRCRSISIGKSRLGRQSPDQGELSAPPPANKSSRGSA